jgi:hypothetical protein
MSCSKGSKKRKVVEEVNVLIDEAEEHEEVEDSDNDDDDDENEMNEEEEPDEEPDEEPVTKKQKGKSSALIEKVLIMQHTATLKKAGIKLQIEYTPVKSGYQFKQYCASRVFSSKNL